MHTAFFEMKQAHLSALRFSRVQTAPRGLTPARLDMLRAILVGGTNGLLQSALRHRLCVGKPVISVMVRALEAIGFVTRERSTRDRRTFVVRLTNRAKVALRNIYYDTIVMGFLELALKGVFLRRGEFYARWHIALHRLEQRLRMVRDAFGIGSHNPWFFDEDDGDFYYADVTGNWNRLDIIPSWEERKAAGEDVDPDDFADDPTSPSFQG